MPLDRAGRVQVNPDLSLPGHPEVFAIGDLALIMDEHNQPVPGVSPAAMQMARHAARIIARRIARCWRHRKQGRISNIGTKDDGDHWPVKGGGANWKDSDSPAGWPWARWLLIHLLYLIGFRNKVAVLIQWTYSYFTYKRGSRIITGGDDVRPLQR